MGTTVYLKIINFIYMYTLILQHMWKSKQRKNAGTMLR